MLYSAKFYGRCFIRVYEDKSPVIKLCAVKHYTIIIKVKTEGPTAFVFYALFLSALAVQ